MQDYAHVNLNAKKLEKKTSIQSYRVEFVKKIGKIRPFFKFATRSFARKIFKQYAIGSNSTSTASWMTSAHGRIEIFSEICLDAYSAAKMLPLPPH